MASNIYSYPYPVLGNRDDIDADIIDCDLDSKAVENRLILKLPELKITHPDLSEFIKNGKAAWLIRVMCSRTYFREIDIVSSDTWEKIFDSSDLEGEVNVGISIIAMSDIEKYSPQFMNEDYGNQQFFIEKSSILAIGPSFKIQIDKQFDPLKAPMSSFIRIIPGDFQSGPCDLTLDDDLIYVELSKQDWNGYAGIKDRAYSVLHSSLILPVLAEAIREIEKHNDSMWSSRLQALIAEKKLDVDKPFETAQFLLDCPIERTFENLNLILDNLKE